VIAAAEQEEEGAGGKNKGSRRRRQGDEGSTSRLCVSSVFGSQEVGFFHLKEHFLDTFVPDGGSRMLKSQGRSTGTMCCRRALGQIRCLPNTGDTHIWQRVRGSLISVFP
jgi:hypothetical protein